MVISFTYRFILIALLPLIAFMIYVNGQRYNPALINFASSQFKADSITALFPEKIGDFSRLEPIRTYNKENLFEYVNGHAEYFISAGFLKLGVGEYGLDSKNAPDITVDIYDMEKSIQAFGLLNDESRGNLSELHSGVRGIRTPLGISFSKGQYYIKISSFNDTLSLDEFAEQIDMGIARGAAPPSEFSRLPDAGDVVTTRFIKESYRGLDFVNNVVEREYTINGSAVQVFLIEGSSKEIDTIIVSFKEYFRNSDIPFKEEEKKGKKLYLINDPYEGDWTLIALPDALFGIFGPFNNTIIHSILKESDQ